MRVTEPGPGRGPVGRWAGGRDKESSDKAAVGQMRLLLASVTFRSVVIGEGEKDEAVDAAQRWGSRSRDRP